MWVSNACFRVVLKYMYLEFSVLFFQFLSFPIYRVFFFFFKVRTQDLSHAGSDYASQNVWAHGYQGKCVSNWLLLPLLVQKGAKKWWQRVDSLLMNKLQWTGLTGTQDFLNKGPLEFLCKQQSDFSPFWYT